MSIYIRYVLFGVVKIFFVTLLAFTILLLSVTIIGTSVKSGAPFLLSVRLAPYSIPTIFSLTLPGASLLAVTFFFSKMGGNNEIIALKAMGIPPWKVLLPVWGFMFFVSLSGIWFNDLSTSWTRMQIKRALLEGFESTLLTQLKTEKRFVTPTKQFEVKVSDVLEDGTLVEPEITGKVGGINCSAKSAKVDIDFNVENPLVMIHLEDAQIDTTKAQVFIPSTYDFPIPLHEVFFDNRRVDPPAKEVKDALTNLEVERCRYHKGIASQAMFSFLSGNINATTNEDWKGRRGTEKYYDKQNIRFKLTIPRICAAGFSCFFFVWVGAPYAILNKKTEPVVVFASSFIPIMGIYSILFTLGLEGAKSGVFPPMATWLGNVALGIIGAILLKKIH